MVITASPARVAAILAGILGFALLPPGVAFLGGSSGAAMTAGPLVSVIELTKVRPLLAQADDLAAPP